MECMLCGGCCVAPDLAALDKPLGVRCPHLQEDLRCSVYEARPEVCRSYPADELCERIAAPTLDERVEKYLAIFGLGDEAARVRAAGFTSMREARGAKGSVRQLVPGAKDTRGRLHLPVTP